MNRSFLIVIIIATSLTWLISSCSGEKKHIASLVKSFENEQFALPNKLLCVNGHSIEMDSLRNNNLSLVFYFEPQDCSRCALSSLETYESMFEIVERYPELQVIIIFSPHEDELTNLIELIKNESYSFPIYIDYERELIHNTHLKNKLLQSFLLDENGHPILVGNPVTSIRVKNLLLDLLQERTNEND